MAIDIQKTLQIQKLLPHPCNVQHDPGLPLSLSATLLTVGGRGQSYITPEGLRKILLEVLFHNENSMLLSIRLCRSKTVSFLFLFFFFVYPLAYVCFCLCSYFSRLYVPDTIGRGREVRRKGVQGARSGGRDR